MYFKNLRSLNTYVIYQPYLQYVESAMYLELQLNVIINYYFLLDYKIRPLQNIAVLPKTLFQSIVSLAQLASKQTINCKCAPPSPQRSFIITVNLRYRSRFFNAQLQCSARSLMYQLSFLRVNAISRRVRTIVNIRLLIPCQYSVMLIQVSLLVASLNKV